MLNGNPPAACVRALLGAGLVAQLVRIVDTCEAGQRRSGATIILAKLANEYPESRISLHAALLISRDPTRATALASRLSSQMHASCSVRML